MSRRLTLTAVAGLLAVLAFLAPTAPAAAQTDTAPLRRTVLALYDGAANENSVRLSRVHAYAAMPLNHLGLKLIYRDVRDPLPGPDDLPDLRGVLTWFGGDVPDPVDYLHWAIGLAERGIPFAVLGDAGLGAAPLELQNRFLQHLGLRTEGDFQLLTYDTELVQADPAMIGFERRPLPPYAPYSAYLPGDTEARLHLAARRRGQEEIHPLVVTAPGGGFAAAGYEYYFDTQIVRGRWIVDPFAFFERVFGTAGLPRPDVTTLAGRRIYFSHVDGDGWRNISRVEGYRDEASGATMALMDKAWSAYPDLPVTVAPIAAEMDLDYAGSERDLALAARIFRLPHVEAGSHTYSHPFVWRFFARYDAAEERRIEAEAGRLPADTSGTWDRMMARFGMGPETQYLVSEGGGDEEHAVMRAFSNVPYSLEREIAGSAEKIGALLPPGKRVQLLQWSGDTSPFPAAVAATRAAGMQNMNGGDTRFDPEYPSLLFVSPLAYTGEDIVQPYAQSSNENTYTDLWSDRFYGLRFLAATLANTERPRRLKAFNIYYHNYSGERPESLQAVTDLLDLAMRSEIAPIEASRFAAMVDGFHFVELVPLGADAWRVEGRGALETIRFDGAAFRAVDFARSRGVVGQRHYQGSLYVALDPDAPETVVALRDIARTDVPPEAAQPYLISARWPVRSLKPDPQGGFTARVRGYGRGEFLWRVAPERLYAIEALADGDPVWRAEVRADAAGRLAFTLGPGGLAGLGLRVVPLPDGPS